MWEGVSFNRDNSSSYCEKNDLMVSSAANYHQIDNAYEVLKQKETYRIKY